jgi:hypothetical protein
LLDESLVIEDQEIDGREDEKIEMSLESSGDDDDDDDVYFIELKYVDYKNLFPYGPAKTA